MADELPDAIIVGDLKPLEEASQSLVLDIKTLSVGLTLPVIMLTTQARPEQIREGFACGADDYITKPFSPRSLVTTLKTLLDARSIV
jgi:DNA-binding response OmpR family regulator